MSISGTSEADMAYGLAGEKLGHSYSKIIHEKLGLYSYELFEIPRDDFAEFMRKRDFDGLNVTIPYKREVMQYLDGIDLIADEIGAVDTLCFWHGGSNGKKMLVGANTDYFGFLYMAKRAGISLTEKSVIILGTGGAAHMARYAAAYKDAAEISVVSRSEHEEETVSTPSGSMTVRYITYDDLEKDTDGIAGRAQIVINATPVGMYPDVDASPASLDLFPSCEGVLDLIYNPFRTKLLQAAEKRHIKNSNGLAMLTAQALKAAELWTGKDLIGKTGAITSEIEREFGNVILIGMPGCGKSSLGTALARQLGHDVVDTDTEIEKREGRSPAAIIEEDGEDAFRDIESKVLSDVCRQNSLVISTGGGSILRQENVDAMHRNGTVFLVERNIEDLESDGRPLSGGLEKRRALFARRRTRYSGAADFTIDNNGSIEASIEQIMKAINS